MKYQNDKKKYLEKCKVCSKACQSFQPQDKIILLLLLLFLLTEFCTIYNNNNILCYMYIAVQHKYIH